MRPHVRLGLASVASPLEVGADEAPALLGRLREGFEGCEALEIRLVTVGIDLLFKHLIRIFQMHLLGSQFLTLQIQGPSDEDAGQSTENGGQSTKGFSKLRTTIM